MNKEALNKFWKALVDHGVEIDVGTSYREAIDKDLWGWKRTDGNGKRLDHFERGLLAGAPDDAPLAYELRETKIERLILSQCERHRHCLRALYELEYGWVPELV